MLIDRYTKHSIFSLPLIFDNLFTKDELLDSDFVNMYLYDMNNPILSNHIFLVFHNIKKPLLNRLTNICIYHNTYTIVKDNIPYTVISFNRSFIVKNVIDRINKGLYCELSYESKLKILWFWNNKGFSSKLHSYLFDKDAKVEKPLSENITLEDKRKAVA